MPDSRRTLMWRVEANCPDLGIIRQAGLILRTGGLVAFPTETVYGLGANALDEAAVKDIFTAKGRPQDNPLIVHIDRIDLLYRYSSFVPEKARLLMEKFWPGPLTLILPGNGKIAETVSGGLSSIAFRIPDHPVALALIREAGVPVAAPSANLSGRPSPTTADHVSSDLRGRIDVILDGGSSGMGVESTVLDVAREVPVILRPGGVTPEEIQAVVGSVAIDASIEINGLVSSSPRSPGMKYRHYAPSAPLVLVEGDPAGVVRKIKSLADEYMCHGKKVGILCRENNRCEYAGILTVAAGTAFDQASVAAALYDALRSFEGSGVDIILAEGVNPRGMGLAVANRLRKASGGKIFIVN